MVVRGDLWGEVVLVMMESGEFSVEE